MAFPPRRIIIGAEVLLGGEGGGRRRGEFCGKVIVAMGWDGMGWDGMGWDVME